MYKTLIPPQLLYTDVIANNARFFAGKPVAICGDDRLSWAEFERRTNRIAHALLGLGLGKGDKVCLLMQTSIEMFELLWGTVKAGCVTVPLNVMMAKDSLALMINNSEAKVLVVDSKTASMIEAIRDRLEGVQAGGFLAVDHEGAGWRDAGALIDAASDADPEIALDLTDSMNIIYSSGTTGVPKGIEHSHAARHLYPLGFGPGLGIDRFAVSICSTPLYTNGTWITMLPTVYWGGTTVLMREFSPAGFLELIARERCTHAFMVPTQFIVVCAHPEIARHDVSSMRCLLSGGQPLPTKTFNELREKFPKAGLYECYGQTEGFVTLCTPADYARGKYGSVGLPIFGGDVIIIDESGTPLPRGETGEICGWSPGLMKGYYRDAKRTDEVVWQGPRGRTYLRSGDVGQMDEDGYLYISGRIKDMIKSGGINVFASDIEEVFMKHPQVLEAAAIGVPHDKWGETPLLLAIMREDATVSEQALMDWGNSQLGKYQRVSRVEFRAAFPRATHDKVLKRALRDPYWEGRERKI